MMDTIIGKHKTNKNNNKKHAHRTERHTAEKKALPDVFCSLCEVCLSVFY